jgi:cytoskeleton protein RodZ
VAASNATPAPVAAGNAPAVSNAPAPAVSNTFPADSDLLPPSAVPSVTAAAPSAGSRTVTVVAAASPGPRSAGAEPGTSSDLTPGVGHARLRLSFSADSRVDVYDYSGKPVFTGNGRANSVKTIAGIAPFRVYLGFASGVQLQVNDRAVAIGPQFVSGDVARFEAGADGVLRRDTRVTPTNGAPAPLTSPRG